MMYQVAAIAGMPMSDEDNWNDPDAPKQQYTATLVDVEDGFKLGDTLPFEAATDIEATGMAYQWGLAECRRMGRLARLIVVSEGRGVHSEVLDPFS
jgi:hypothetical protein